MGTNSKRLQDQFHHLTMNFSPEDWRKVRNEDYWISDYLSPDKRLLHKLERVEYYHRHGVIKPYSPGKVREIHESDGKLLREQDVDDEPYYKCAE